MSRIKLTKGVVAIIDNEDFDFIAKYNWYFNGRYAVRTDKRKTIYMHRFIMGNPDNYIDHSNGNMLDNRKLNLRVCTQSQNRANSKINKRNLSGHKGVSWCDPMKCWVSRIKVGEHIFREYSKTKEDASIKYKELALKYFKEFARFK